MNGSILLIVDAQVGVLRNTWDASRIIENISLAVEKAQGARHTSDLGTAHR